MDVEDVRLAVFDAFRNGQIPTVVSLAAATGVDVADVRAALDELHTTRNVVLGADGEIVMAHPFTAVPLGFSVMGRDRLWWGGCAWDSFAIPHLIPEEPSVLIATSCPACDAALAWVVTRDHPPDEDQVAHFLTPTSRIWNDVVHACANQRIFCSAQHVDDWLAHTGQDRGYVMDLGTLWRLARGWYAGRLDRGYQRRDPSSALEYFASVGLHGSFWGLSD